MHNFAVNDELKKKLSKISKKNKELYEQIMKKIDEIINSYDVEHYKNLRQGMKDLKRAHIGHFVLVFRFDKGNNFIFFDDFDHHDLIYEE
jgi:YafQ family addiction module toxin component